MATIRILLGIICLGIGVRAIEPSVNILRIEARKVAGRKLEGIGFSGERLGGRNLGLGVSKLSAVNWKLQAADRELILAIAQSQIGVREATGKNDGAAVEAFLNYTGNKKGDAWCASFVSWVYRQVGFLKPKTAWSPALFPSAKQTTSPLPADVFGIYFPKLKRIAHCGIVEGYRANWIYTIEGNTNLVGSREGDGVYRKLRHRRSIKSFANWIDEPRKEASK